MFGARSPRALVAALALGLAAGAAGITVTVATATAATPHHAAVIVDTGSTVKRVVVTFGEDSITGIDALQRAGMNPVVYQFGGQGGAVCRLLGVGRDAGPNCLGGGDGDARYWAYFRAPTGTSSFKYSSVGAGSARVQDGDVEGWKFGTGTAPQFVSLASLLPPPPPPPTQPPATNPPGTAAPGAGSGGAPAVGTEAAVTPGLSTSSSSLPNTGGTSKGATGATGSTAKDGKARSTSDGSEASGASSDDGKTVDAALASSDQDGGGGSGWSLALFAILLLAIAAAIFLVRRVRKNAAAG